MTMLQTKVSLSNFQPKRMMNVLWPEGGGSLKELELGSIVGIANGVKNGFQQDGVTPYQGMTGNFEVVFTGQKDKDGKTPEGIASGVCYLPDAFMDPILQMLAGEGHNEQINGAEKWVWDKEPISSVSFAFKVYMIPAENPAKYSWQLRSALEATANDPLAELKKLLGSPAATPTIEPPKTEAAPEKAGAKK